MDKMQSHITYGQFYGCAEDPNLASRLESVSVPRRDAPACPGGPANARGPAVDLNLAFAPEDDTPENRTQFFYSGLVALADSPSPDGVPGLDVTPGVFSAQDGHPVQVREADEGGSWPVVRLGDTEVTIRGQRYAVDVRASHTWQNACSTDDTGGWISLALARME